MVTTRSQSHSNNQRLDQPQLGPLLPGENRPGKRPRTYKDHETSHRKRIKPVDHQAANHTQPRDDELASAGICPRSEGHFGLIQERLRGKPGSQEHIYKLLVQSTLWNQTSGKMALPVLVRLLQKYPDTEALADAKYKDLEGMLYPIGLYKQRASRLINFAQTWIEAPPSADRRYRKMHYPIKGRGRDVGVHEVLSKEDEREGWEVAHLPGVGRYALDAFRIFCRDGLRGVDQEEETEPEWQRVVLGEQGDKDLRAYLEWRWSREGWKWNHLNGQKTSI